MATKNSIDSNIPIEIAKGGTNATTMATSSGLVKYDGTRLVTSATATLDASNRMINTNQPRFSAYKSSNTNNVTGNGALYSFVCDTELFDIGANYNNVTGIFTAPVTGLYWFGTSVFLFGCTITGTLELSLKTTAVVNDQNNHRTPSASNYQLQNTSIFSMAAGDTCFPTIRATGEAGDTDDLLGAANNFATSFMGYLIC